MAVVLMASGTALTLKQKYDLELNNKYTQITALAQTGQSVIESYVKLAQSGAMTTAQAQAAAAAAVSAIRYNGNGYMFVQDYQGTYVVHPNKALIGTNAMNSRDPTGRLITRPMIDSAMSGHPQFNHYEYPKVPGGKPFPKIALMLAVPQWQWAIGTGVYIDDIQHELINNSIWLAVIYTPLILAFMFIVFVMRRAISRTLGGLAGTMRQLAAGELNTDIPGMERGDELGDMARAVEVFKNNAVEKVRLEREALAARAAAEEERKANEALRQDTEAQQREVVSAVAGGLERLSDGDLLFRLNTPFASAYEKLRGDFNAAMENLQKTMLAITESTQTVRGQAGQMMQASDDLSLRTEQQAASLEETAAALDQVTATVRHTAKNAGEASEVIGHAREDAEHSGNVVRETVAAMGNIEASARKIDNIIGVIDEIAFQTNLLALNAGVEAARAGDAGRGFAVVATEVRALAQRSADAAKEIKALISASGKQVESGVKLVGETGTALGKIVEQVSKISALVVSIAASAQEQASGLNEVNSAVNQMDNVTQKNAAMVEESTAASHSLATEAETLGQLVNRFRIGATNPAPRPTAVKARPASRLVSKPVAKPPVAKPPVAKPSSALASAGEEDWDEF
ncbi:MAG: hypothetical protein B7X08_01190 [Acidocella sp. 20-63-7]|nr:MAG: hypothetical protein B7X08_01190 [Acidocella sp. 20-63-7]